MGIFDFFKSKEFEELFEKALEEEMAKPHDKNEIYNEIANNYFVLLSLLNIDRFGLFQFYDYEDPRKVLVDATKHDFDNEFCHDDSNATEALCAIDCLIANLEEESLAKILNKIEKKINTQNQKLK